MVSNVHAREGFRCTREPPPEGSYVSLCPPLTSQPLYIPYSSLCFRFFLILSSCQHRYNQRMSLKGRNIHEHVFVHVSLTKVYIHTLLFHCSSITFMQILSAVHKALNWKFHYINRITVNLHPDATRES